MSSFAHKHGRKTIYFTDHALDRWWERCEDNDLHGRQAAMNLLRERLDAAAQEDRRTLIQDAPPWSRISLWNRARAELYLLLSDYGCFVINRNESGHLVAVTYIEEIKERQEVPHEQHRND